MNINENLKKWVKIIKNTINKQIPALNHHQTSVVACFMTPVIHYDKFFHPVVQYENFLICIFMNIKENLKNEGKMIGYTNTYSGN